MGELSGHSFLNGVLTDLARSNSQIETALQQPAMMTMMSLAWNIYTATMFAHAALMFYVARRKSDKVWIYLRAFAPYGWSLVAVLGAIVGGVFI